MLIYVAAALAGSIAAVPVWIAWLYVDSWMFWRR